MNRIIYYISFFAMLLSFSSCKVSNFLSEGSVLYTESEIFFEEPKEIWKANALKADIQSQLYPTPNKKFLGLFYTKIWLHEKVQPKEHKKKSFRHWLKFKLGEAPVLISDVDKDLMSLVIDKEMSDHGYFNSKTKFGVIEKNAKATILYNVYNGVPNQIDSVILPNSDAELDSLIRNFKDFQTKKGKYYDLKQLKADRTALATYVRSYGYFDFSEQDVFYLIDTSLQKGHINVHFRVKAPASGKEHQKYYISDITVYPTYESSSLIKDSLEYPIEYNYNGYDFKMNYKFVGYRTIGNNILIEPKSLFSVRDYNLTSKRFSNLDVYKFVNINYEKTPEDSLSVAIQLTPGRHQSVRGEIEATTSNRSFLGTLIGLSYSNKNVFRSAADFSISASGGTEFQFIDSKATLNILDFNFETKLSYPKLLIGWRVKKIKSGATPKTIVAFKENFQKWLQYYTYNSINLSFGYDWYVNDKQHHELTPIFINFLNLLETTAEFDDILSANPLLRTSFNSNLIIGRNYTYSTNSQKDDDQRSYVYFSGTVESAGNLSYAISRAANKDNTDPYQVFGLPFSQYTKFDINFRHYWNITDKTQLVSRVNPGFGFAYGNSEILPYSKQFFVGGPNTLRAFGFRSVGPGRYKSDAVVSNPLEQSGDIKILLNTELRYPIYEFIKGAVFVDAGNVWLRSTDPDRAEGTFELNSFYKELALGTGAGIRLDFDFFAIRADLGIPLYKPYAVNGERWINQYPEQGFKAWRKENFVWNIAIGYPF